MQSKNEQVNSITIIIFFLRIVFSSKLPWIKIKNLKLIVLENPATLVPFLAESPKANTLWNVVSTSLFLSEHLICHNCERLVHHSKICQWGTQSTLNALFLFQLLRATLFSDSKTNCKVACTKISKTTSLLLDTEWRNMVWMRPLSLLLIKSFCQKLKNFY